MLRKISSRFLVPNCTRLTQKCNAHNGENTKNPFAINWRERQDQTRRSAKIHGTPDNTSYIFFPGQGSQYVGMVKELIKYPEVKNMFELANEVLKFNLLKLCLEGPQEKLNQTIYCQPAVFVASLASLERLKELYPDAIDQCAVTAGFSLGELTALTFAGALPFDKALHLVKIRAELMQKAGDENPGGMATIFYGHDAQLGLACKEAIDWCIDRGIENADCTIANYLFPDCKVIAGSLEALKFIEAHLKKYKLRSMRRLPVSGAFHTSLMSSAVEPFAEELKKIYVEEPMVHVYSNVYGTPYQSPTNILNVLPQQIVRPVKWEQMLHTIYTRNKDDKFPKTYVCGPGTALMTILKQVNLKAWESTKKIDC